MQLLRIALDTKQVREACEEFAMRRSAYCADPSFIAKAEGLADGTECTVVFTKKRVRSKTKSTEETK